MNIQKYRDKQLSSLTQLTGVYALCDLDEVPIYVGETTEGIRSRVRRHLTSARSDAIANRLLDVWEIAYVWAWAVPKEERLKMRNLEMHLISFYDARSPLINIKIPAIPLKLDIIPVKEQISVLPNEEIERRRNPLLRFERQIQHFSNLFSHAIEVKDNKHTRRALETHFLRLNNYYHNFMGTKTLSAEK